MTRVESLTRRDDDIKATADGRHVGRLDHAFKDGLDVREAQLVQHRLSELRVRVVPCTPPQVGEQPIVIAGRSQESGP